MNGRIASQESAIGRSVALDLDVNGNRAAWATGRFVRGTVFLDAVMADGAGLSLAMRRAGDGSLTIVADGFWRGEAALVPAAATWRVEETRRRFRRARS